MKHKPLVVYTGKIVSVSTREVVLPNGHCMGMETVHHPGGAAIVALNESNEVCLLRQYRAILDDWVWEIPAGKIDNNEDPLATAKRELAEEASCNAASWTDLGYILSSPGIFTEKVYLYIARQLTNSDVAREPNEVFDIHWVPLYEALDWCNCGKIKDAKTLVALYQTDSKNRLNL